MEKFMDTLRDYDSEAMQVTACFDDGISDIVESTTKLNKMNENSVVVRGYIGNCWSGKTFTNSYNPFWNTKKGYTEFSSDRLEDVQKVIENVTNDSGKDIRSIKTYYYDAVAKRFWVQVGTLNPADKMTDAQFQAALRNRGIAVAEIEELIQSLIPSS